LQVYLIQVKALAAKKQQKRQRAAGLPETHNFLFTLGCAVLSATLLVIDTLCFFTSSRLIDYEKMYCFV